MKVLVTGACGYQGSNLVEKLLSIGHSVFAVDVMWFGNYLESHKQLTVFEGDICDPKDAWFAGVETVIHLASVANDPCADLSPKLTWEIGPLATMRLAEHTLHHEIKQFIYASSAGVYGVCKEAQVTEDLPLNPISDYNKSKMVAERVLMSYADKFALTIIRPATVCGYSPRMRLDVSVNMLTMQALTKKKITVFGGEQVRPNIHIDDLVDCYIYFLNNTQYTGVYNAGFENLSILQIAEMVQSKIPCEIIVTPSSDSRSYRLNSDKLIEIGFSPSKSVENAIDELTHQYDENNLEDKDFFYNMRTMKKKLDAEV